MSELQRISISIESELHEQLERLVAETDYANRSEFIRDLIRARLVQRQWARNARAVGTITLVYDHHRRQLSDRLMHVQHHYHREILSTMHIHLDEDLCVEAILARGRARKLEELADRLQREKGVLHASLSMSGLGS
jgi:CopG family nickel-responsive transcriptional regulator